MSLGEDARRRPWMKLNVIDFFLDDAVGKMEPLEQGAYLRGLARSWMTEEPGIGTPAQWGDWMGYSSDQWDYAEERFAPGAGASPFELMEDGRWLQPRLRREVEELRTVREGARNAGIKGARSRWGTHRVPMATPWGTHRVGWRDVEVDSRGAPPPYNPPGVVDSFLSEAKGDARASAGAHAREGGQNGSSGGEEGGEAEGRGPGDVGREALGAGVGPAGVAGAGGADGAGGVPAGAGRDPADDAGGDAGHVRGGGPELGGADGRPARAQGRHKDPARDEWEAAFPDFYGPYPRKVSPKAALAAWMKIEPKTQETFDLIDMGLQRHIEAWKFREKDKIPHPATWLNQRRWEGEA